MNATSSFFCKWFKARRISTLLVLYIDGVRVESERLLLMTDVSTTWAAIIFRDEWRVFVFDYFYFYFYHLTRFLWLKYIRESCERKRHFNAYVELLITTGVATTFYLIWETNHCLAVHIENFLLSVSQSVSKTGGSLALELLIFAKRHPEVVYQICTQNLPEVVPSLHSQFSP